MAFQKRVQVAQISCDNMNVGRGIRQTDQLGIDVLWIAHNGEDCILAVLRLPQSITIRRWSTFLTYTLTS